MSMSLLNRSCSLLVGVPGYRSRDPGFYSRPYQILWAVDLELGPLSLVGTIEGLLGRNSSSSGLQNREYGRGHALRWPRNTLYQQKLALTSPKSGGRSIGIVRLQTKITEFVCLFWGYWTRLKLAGDIYMDWVCSNISWFSWKYIFLHFRETEKEEWEGVCNKRHCM
jgi:hypothetical protein